MPPSMLHMRDAELKRARRSLIILFWKSWIRIAFEMRKDMEWISILVHPDKIKIASESWLDCGRPLYERIAGHLFEPL